LRYLLLYVTLFLLTSCGGGKKNLFMPDSNRWTDQDIPLNELDTGSINTDSIVISDKMRSLFHASDSLIEGRPVSFYLERADVSPIAKNFYLLKFIPSDDNATSSLCDSLLTTNDTTRPFYYFLFLRLFRLADGGLAELISNYAVHYAIEFVDDFYKKIDMPQYKWSYPEWVEYFVAVKGNAGAYIISNQIKNAKHLTSSLRKKIQKFADDVDKFENP
jgi:hypothetical protein